MKWTDFLSVEKKLILNKSNIDNDKTYVGIDFGTSTTVVSIAKLDKDNNLIAEHIDIKQTLFSGATRTDYRVNSAVAYYKKKILIGTGAKELQLKLKQNINYWQSFKMQLGSDVGVAYPESEIATLKNPTDVITLFFRALKNSIDTYINDKGLSNEIKYSVSIPASFESHHRRELIECLKAAKIDINESGLIDEPNAAFLSYSLLANNNGNELYISSKFNPNVLVFDFGAGTCDISIIEIGENTNGLHTKNISLSQFAEIGGDNFDKLIAKKVLLPQMLEQSKVKKGVLRDREIQLEVLPHLKDIGEKLKIQVSEKIESYHDIVNFSEKELQEHKFHVATTKKISSRIGELQIHNPEINLKQFIDISNSFQFDINFKDMNLQINPVFSAMEKAKLIPDDIDYVLFIGGSTKNFLIRKQIKSVFSKATALEPNNPQSHVSKGAAIHALLLHKFDTQIIRPITNQNVFTIITSDNEERKISLINAGEPVPFPTKNFTQFHPNQDGQKVIEIPFFAGNDAVELEKIVIESINSGGFKKKDKINLSVDVNANKVLVIIATINDIEAKVNIDNPFLSAGKTLNNKEIINAIKSFNKDASKNNGTASSSSYKNLISTYEKHKDFLAAAELLEEAVERHDLQDEFNNLNLLYGKVGNDEKSEKYAEKAVESSPNNSIILFNLACKLRYSNRNRAIELLKKAHALDSNRPLIKYLLGNLLSGSEGKSLMRDAFNLWQAKLIINNIDSSEYSWFSSCAWELGEHTLYHQILQKQADIQNKDIGFYDRENLMSMSEKISKKK